jgi:hypothetical protein
MDIRKNEDNKEYIGFCGPQRIHKAVNELEGILKGMTCDNALNSRELSLLTRWIGQYQQFRKRCPPLADTVDLLHQVLADGVIEDEELLDLQWACGQFGDDNEYYCQLTADMQRLQGFLAGIIADSEISREELNALRSWMEDHDSLKGCWPYDELESVISAVLRDGAVTEQEHEDLVAYFKEFAASTDKAIGLKEGPPASFAIRGVCAVAPEIVFQGKAFCLTGTSSRAPRKEIQGHIVGRGGTFLKSLTQAANYLIVCSEGNPCWAFSCYGRKVEQAVALRKDGHKVLIVHEADFWDHLN